MSFRYHPLYKLIPLKSQLLTIVLIAAITLCPLQCVVGLCCAEVQIKPAKVQLPTCSCCAHNHRALPTDSAGFSARGNNNRQPVDQCECINCVCNGAVATKLIDDGRLSDSESSDERQSISVKQWTKCSFKRNILQTFSLHALCDDSMKVRACLNNWTL